ncbi:MAG: quinone-dependent dihydroorotate dehydrogenase [Steroidobacteraceae bacterium]
MLYPLVKKLLFQLEPERAHALSLSGLRHLQQSGLLALMYSSRPSPVTLMGLQFPNRVGIAAGLDKNAVCIDALSALGAGCVEVGTVTPRPQAGNPKPRIFRLPQAQALINRMGFPNAGMDAIVARLAVRRSQGICGVNIGKNASTPLEQATQDYLSCLRTMAPYADYIAVNVSSPNTVGLRSLQAAAQLRPLLLALLDERARLLPTLGRPLPMVVKIAPDLSDDDLNSVADLLLELGVDGVIATNTTLSRPVGLGSMGGQTGGLSGRPVHVLSLATVSKLRLRMGKDFPIIGVGGISSATEAVAMRQAGADLIQIYTGLIYRGPGLISEVAAALA